MYLPGTAGWALRAQQHPQTSQPPQAGWTQLQEHSIHPGTPPFQQPSQLQPAPPSQSVFKICTCIIECKKQKTRVHLPWCTAYLFRVPVEVQIRHDLPWVLPGDGTPHSEHLPGQHPPHQTHRVVTLQHNHRLANDKRYTILICCFRFYNTSTEGMTFSFLWQTSTPISEWFREGKLEVRLFYLAHILHPAQHKQDSAGL